MIRINKKSKMYQSEDGNRKISVKYVKCKKLCVITYLNISNFARGEAEHLGPSIFVEMQDKPNYNLYIYLFYVIYLYLYSLVPMYCGILMNTHSCTVITRSTFPLTCHFVSIKTPQSISPHTNVVFL